MSTLERISKALLLILVVSLPFEFRTVPFSNLQLLFLALAVVSLPLLARDWRTLLRDRFVIAALVFVLSQWLTAMLAGPLMMNSLKAAARVSSGLLLACIVLRQSDRVVFLRAWCVASVVAAVYGLVDFAGFGEPGFFREAQFYFGDQLRLSGSFEYPTTAAAYYAMSLPLVFLAPMSLRVRILGAVLLWSALLLTYSRGAAIATAAVLLCGIGFSRPRLAAQLAAAGIGAAVIIGIFQPALITRFSSANAEKAAAGEYKLDYNMIRHHPMAKDSFDVTLRNTGVETWPSSGEDAVSLSYHWYDTARKRIVPMPAIETPLPHDIRPNGTATVTAHFQTPDHPGLYLLDWDLKRKDMGWFSTHHKVVVAVVEAQIEDGAAVWKGNGDVNRWYRRTEDSRPQLDASVTRADLWSAAARLFQVAPLFGSGPDNFRLLYGPQLGFERWDTNIRSNNLYLELLAGSGLIGLAAFAAMLASLRWSFSPAAMSIAVFLLHGFVDVLLMTTPIYFGFWILMGLQREMQ
jgi:hypothetical protein